MRSLLARMSVLGALAFSLSACGGGGNATSLPFAGSPNNAGGSNGTIISGSNGLSLLRFVQGSPDTGAGATFAVDVCIDQQPLGINGPSVAYGKTAPLFEVAAGVAHVLSVFPAGSGGSPAGTECATAPGPYLGSSAYAVLTFTPPVNSRQSIVLAGTTAKKTLSLLLFSDNFFTIAPASAEAITHNAALNFSATAPTKGVGFGYLPTAAGPPTNLTPNLAAPKPGGVSQTNGSPLPGQPASFYDGLGVLSGTVVPITTVPAPAPPFGQPPVYLLYAIDAPAGGLGLVVVPETTVGYGF